LNPFEAGGQVQITLPALRRIRRGHLWVYAGGVMKEPAAGNPAIVQVLDTSGNSTGYAFYSRKSQIRLRFLSRDPEPLSPDFFKNRLLRSFARRQTLFKEADACRLVFGEGDLLPGIIVDRYRNYLVVQTLSSGADAIKPFLIEILLEVLRPDGILERNDVKARRLEGLEERRSILWGNVPEEVEIVENGIRFAVDLLKGQKTGFFLDQSQNRIEAGKYARGEALDCFTHTGAFALHFARKCESVVAVDISPDSLMLARKNGALNGCHNIEFVQGNVFDFLRDMESSGRTFDTICLDPPAFAKNRNALAGARSGYKEINLRALKLLRREGILITSSCSYHMSAEDFFALLCDAARDAHRDIQLIERRSQASDHPILAGMPETHYLKCFFLRVI
jgi:23S rRNA (cytosine1962-C5)-methyltransferase